MTNKTVFVVDDDEIILEAIKALLESKGYNVITATNFREAIEIVDNTSLDLMLLDINMPEVDGTAILHITKHSAHLEKQFPIIYVTGMPKENVNLEGSDGFIQKPFKNKEFIKYIEDILQKFGEKNENNLSSR